jgi:hypothetical protein
VLDAVGVAAQALDRSRQVARVGAALQLEHRGDALALDVGEALQRLVDLLGPGARRGEAAARQVLGLAHRERQRREQRDDPEHDDEAAVPLDEVRQPVHRPLHPDPPKLAGQPICPRAGAGGVNYVTGC